MSPRTQTTEFLLGWKSVRQVCHSVFRIRPELVTRRHSQEISKHVGLLASLGASLFFCTDGIVCGALSMKRSFVCPSICPIRRRHAAAAGLLLWARRAGDIDRLLRQRRVPQCPSPVYLAVVHFHHGYIGGAEMTDTKLQDMKITTKKCIFYSFVLQFPVRHFHVLLFRALPFMSYKFLQFHALRLRPSFSCLAGQLDTCRMSAPESRSGLEVQQTSVKKQTHLLCLFSFQFSLTPQGMSVDFSQPVTLLVQSLEHYLYDTIRYEMLF